MLSNKKIRYHRADFLFSIVVKTKTLLMLKYLIPSFFYFLHQKSL